MSVRPQVTFQVQFKDHPGPEWSRRPAAAAAPRQLQQRLVQQRRHARVQASADDVGEQQSVRAAGHQRLHERPAGRRQLEGRLLPEQPPAAAGWSRALGLSRFDTKTSGASHSYHDSKP